MNKNKSSAWGQRFESLVEDFMERGYSKAKDSVDQVVDKAEGLVDSAVDQVQSKIVRPVTIFSRAVAFSIILVVLGLFSLIFLTIGLFRFVDTYLFASHQWLSYLLIGAWFILWGLFILRFRQSRKNRHS